MKEFEALARLIVLVEAHGSEADKEAIVTLGQRATPLPPPTALGQAASEARLFADLCHKTGMASEWVTPPVHSLAMERLIHRLTCVLEVFIDLYGADMKLTYEKPAVVDYRLTDDDMYQVSYCDDCGQALPPTNGCGCSVERST